MWYYIQKFLLVGDIVSNSYSDVCKIYEEYISKMQKADKKYVEDVIAIVLNTDNIYNLVSSIKFGKLNEVVASYNYFDRVINFDDSVLNLPLSVSSEIGIAVNNANILHYILHECVHVRQFNNVIKDEESIESKLLKYTIIGHEIQKEKIKNILEEDNDDSKISLQNLYSKGINEKTLNNLILLDEIVLSERGYVLSPAERMAEYRSIMIMCNIIKNSKYHELITSATNMSNFSNKIKSIGYIKRKEKIFSPTKRYFDYLIKSGMIEIDNYIDEILNNEMSLEDRLYYGLLWWICKGKILKKKIEKD